MSLTLNAVVRIIDEDIGGLYRVVALPPAEGVAFLFCLQQQSSVGHGHPDTIEHPIRPDINKSEKLVRIPLDVLWNLTQREQLITLAFEPDPKLLIRAEFLTAREKQIFDRRFELARPFLDHDRVCEALLSSRGIGKLIAEIRRHKKVARSSLYRLWELLCQYGFDAGSLNPRFDRCGAPGKLRPINEMTKKNQPRKKSGRKSNKERLGIDEPFPQQGVTREMRTKVLASYRVFKRDPKLKFPALYTKIIDNCFVTRVRQTSAGPMIVPPIQGTFPNEQQIRRIITVEEGKLGTKLRGTTKGHFNRNYRGLVGTAWDGIAGPGHVYAIDSTTADIYLRSSINRAWCVGRPIVYVVVDVWSTAVTGFYVCLRAPSWETAKVALFSSISDPVMISELRGNAHMSSLCPPPAAPHAFLCDRGEYLSAGALGTGEELGINMQYNPAYRPDLKGLVEVLNRITKDQQFQFIPGAIDARRKEVELRSNPRDAIFTLQEYVHYLTEVFALYNFCSDRTHRITTAMMSAGVDPTPAGLWKYGHEVGIGYQKSISRSKLITRLLPMQSATISRNGLFFGRLKYESSTIQEKEWTAHARNFGATHIQMHYYPGNTSKIWWIDKDSYGLTTFDLSPAALAPPGISIDEWLDAWAYDKLKKPDLKYQRAVANLNHHHRTKSRIEEAREMTREAEATSDYPDIGTRDARNLENLLHHQAQPPGVQENPGNTNLQAEPLSNSYERMMDELFSVQSDGVEKQ